MGKQIDHKEWSRFMESFDMESDTDNFKYDFKTMTRKYGGAFIEYCKSAWKANGGGQTEEEFRNMHANMPEGFFNNVIK